jgi:hypothetical protein
MGPMMQNPQGWCRMSGIIASDEGNVDCTVYVRNIYGQTSVDLNLDRTVRAAYAALVDNFPMRTFTRLVIDFS